MLRKIVSPLIFVVFLLSSCAQNPGAKGQEVAPIIQPAASVIPSEAVPATEVFTTPVVTPAPSEAQDADPLSSLKGKMVKDDQGYLLLLGLVNTPNAAINFQFPESFQFPHEHVYDDFRILDGNGAALEFEEVDPSELNLYVEKPLGEGIFDPRAFRILQKEVQGPVTLELVNLIQAVNLMEQPTAPFTIQLDADFPLGKNTWPLDQSIHLIPDHPFTIRYFDASVFNDYYKGAYSGPQNTFFNGTYYLEAAGFEGFTFSQIVPAERQAEWPMGGGGAEETCAEVFADCIMSDAGLLKTADNTYELQITAYRLVIQGPWQVQFDLEP